MARWRPANGNEYEYHPLYGIRGWLVVVLVGAACVLAFGLIMLFGSTTLEASLDDGSELHMQIEGLGLAGGSAVVSSALFIILCLAKAASFRWLGSIVIWLGLAATAFLSLTLPLTIAEPTIIPGLTPVTLTPEDIEFFLARWRGMSVFVSGVFGLTAIVTTLYLFLSKRVRITFDKSMPWRDSTY